MHCPICKTLGRQAADDPKAKVIKTETWRDFTHRIYRCPHPDCEATFHTTEVSRTKFRHLEDIQKACQRFARTVQG